MAGFVFHYLTHFARYLQLSVQKFLTATNVHLHHVKYLSEKFGDRKSHSSLSNSADGSGRTLMDPGGPANDSFLKRRSCLFRIVA